MYLNVKKSRLLIHLINHRFILHFRLYWEYGIKCGRIMYIAFGNKAQRKKELHYGIFIFMDGGFTEFSKPIYDHYAGYLIHFGDLCIIITYQSSKKIFEKLNLGCSRLFR